jgi:cysteine desulfurase/selenocysteine lyase
MPATTPTARDAATRFDVDAVRADFPTLRRTVYDDAPLAYLDNAATSQKPQSVIDRMERYYAHENSNVHRGVHRLSQDATDAYEATRQSVAALINAPDPAQVIFTKGTTEAINLVASSYGRMTIAEGDEIVLTEMEHHANIVPWQLLADQVGASLRIAPINDAGELQLDDLIGLMNARTRLVAVSHVSNTLGTINPVETIIDAAHQQGIPVLLDGAQAVPHMPVDVQALDADFYCFSGHKMFGPTGIGVLYGKRDHLEAMPPYQSGGDMIDEVSFEKTTFADVPHKFEAGTPHIAGGIGLGAAIDYLNGLDRDNALQHEHDLLTYATDQVRTIDGLRVIGTAAQKASVLSFLIDGIHPYDAGTVLDRLGIAVRTGHHCTEPLMKRLDLPGTVRASFAFYNTRDDVDRLMEGLHRVKRMFG